MQLNHDLWLYFAVDDLTVYLPLASLVPTKPPETQPDSVDNAERLMNEAALGQRPKRPPITVAPADDGDRFWIVDGNATYGVAERHGWETLPCHVIQSPDLPG